MVHLNNKKNLLEQQSLEDKKKKHKSKTSSKDNSNTQSLEDKKKKHKSKIPSTDNTTIPQDQPTDDGIPKPASGGDIKIQLIYTKTNLPIQNQNFVSAIQKALNKGNDYSSNNIFK